ncbi:hypothetical protein HS125_07345 [bacterium]|nr:hypothetical protein [bacterium]
MRDWRETALYYFQTRARAGEAAFNGGRVEGEARSYLRNYREARKRMESSLSEYDGKYRLYNTEQLHEGLRLMATGAWR